jgi:hypothetical protein
MKFLTIIFILFLTPALRAKDRFECVYNYTEKVNIYIYRHKGVAISKKSIKNNLNYVFYIKNIKKLDSNDDYVLISQGKYKIIYPLHCE